MEKLDITPATTNELNWAATLLQTNDPWLSLGIKPEKILETCNNPDNKVYIAHIEGMACGVIIIHPMVWQVHHMSNQLLLIMNFRSWGIGAALIQYTEDQFQSTARYIFLCVSSFNLRAQVLYENQGFTVHGEFKDYIIDGASEILMSKRLT